MFRFLVGSLALVLLLVGSLQAEDIRARVKTVDKDKGKITLITPDNKERTLDMAKDVRVYGTFSQRFRKTVTLEITNGIATLAPNTDVIAVTEVRDKSSMVTQVRIQGTQQAAPAVIRKK